MLVAVVRRAEAGGQRLAFPWQVEKSKLSRRSDTTTTTSKRRERERDGAFWVPQWMDTQAAFFPAWNGENFAFSKPSKRAAYWPFTKGEGRVGGTVSLWTKNELRSHRVLEQENFPKTRGKRENKWGHKNERSAKGFSESLGGKHKKAHSVIQLYVRIMQHFMKLNRHS